MDIFKLLARSTTLTKSGLDYLRAPQHIPSAGAPADASKDDRGVLQIERAAETESKGTKRKRTNLEDRGTNIPEELNFFGGQGRQRESMREDGDQDKISTELKTGRRNVKDERQDGGVALLSTQERSHILKKHKVKVRILGDAKGTKRGVNGKITKTSGDVDCKKEAHHQIWPQPLTSFAELRRKYRISNRLAENLDAQGYSEPTEVQVGALPLLLGSDSDRGLVDTGSKPNKQLYNTSVDLLTVAPTGSGKTLAYLIPILQGLVEAKRRATFDNEVTREHHLQAVILAPTHELVDQIVNEARKLAIGTGVKVAGMKKGMRVHASPQDGHIKGEDRASDEPLVKAGLLVSTPLMMLHAVSSDSDSKPNLLSSVRYLVLDEADILLDPLFREQTLNVWSACPNPLLQSTLWSATIGSSIESLAQTFILDRRSNLDLNKSPNSNPTHYILRLIVGLKDSAIPFLTHHLTYTASERGKLLALRQLLHPSQTYDETKTPTLQTPFLIFTQTISRAIALHSELRYDIPPEAGGSSRLAVLHADLSTPARSAIMAGLRKGEIWIVITTDLLSRGVDIRGLNGVVNYDIPTTGASYVHRVGRTGRQGRGGGVAVTFYTKDDIPYVKNIANVIEASERARRKAEEKGEESVDATTNGKRDGRGEGATTPGTGVQKWLLDALPRVSKKSKQELKKRGVESRRPSAGKDGRESSARKKARISTKSGFERRMEDRRKGAILGSRRRKRMEERDENGENGGEGGVVNLKQVDAAGEEWGGFDD